MDFENRYDLYFKKCVLWNSYFCFQKNKFSPTSLEIPSCMHERLAQDMLRLYRITELNAREAWERRPRVFVCLCSHAGAMEELDELVTDTYPFWVLERLCWDREKRSLVWRWVDQSC